MKWLDQVHAVESCEHLAVWRAAHRELRRKLIGAQPRQATDRAIEVLANLRQGFQFGAGERDVFCDALLRDAKTAGRHDDFLETERWLNRRGWGGHGRRRFSAPQQRPRGQHHRRREQEPRCVQPAIERVCPTPRGANPLRRRDSHVAGVKVTPVNTRPKGENCFRRMHNTARSQSPSWIHKRRDFSKARHRTLR